MHRAFRENLHSIYILLFLNIAFFFLELQDPQRYRALFALDREAVFGGELWRLVTYQFVQGTFLGSPALSLFFTLMILYIMGTAVEDELGTLRFGAFFFVSTLVSAGVALGLGATLLSSLFLGYSLLFAYARLYPEQTFYIFFVLPLKVRWLAWIALAMLGLGVLTLSPAAIAAAGGAGVSYLYFWWLTRVPTAQFHRPSLPVERSAGEGAEALIKKNLARFARMKETLAGGSADQIGALEKSIAPDIVPGVNICPPPDYKPEHEDRYCARCEGFAECSVRYLRLHAPAEKKLASEEPRAEVQG